MSKLVLLRKRIAGLTPSSVERFVRKVRRELRLRGRVDVLLTGSAELRALNRQFRNKDKATDVLSFSPIEISSKPSRAAGELAISLDIARENANHLGHSVAEEVKILVLHGILHLVGFEHERDNGEMARREARLREKLKLNAGLIERSSTRSTKSRRGLAAGAGRRTA